MKSNKTFALVLCIIILIIFFLVIYYFNDTPVNFNISNITNKIFDTNSSRNVNNNVSKQANNVSNITNNALVVEDNPNLENVTSYDLYFSINNIINDYYKQVINKNSEALLNIIDSSYIVSNKINKSNISSFYQDKYQDIAYYAKQMYFKSKNNILYYFVSGETESYNFVEDTLEENDNINYLVIVDRNTNSYSITPLDIDTVFNYGSIYNMLNNKVIESNLNNSYEQKSYSDEEIIIYYLSYFKNILFINSEKAYNMLTNSYKANFFDYETYFNSIPDIYEKISTNFLGISSTGEDTKKTYNVITISEVKIAIFEDSIMNFKVEIK